MSPEVSQHDLALWVIRLSSDQKEELARAQTEFAQWKSRHIQEAQQVESMMQFSQAMQQHSRQSCFHTDTVHQSLSAQHEALLRVKHQWASI